MDTSEDKLTAIKQNHSGSSVADEIQTACDSGISLDDIVAYYAVCQMENEIGKSLSIAERMLEARETRKGLPTSGSPFC